MRFSLDGKALSTENVTPFDLFRTTYDGKALPFDTTILADGVHTVSAAILLEDGQSFTRSATFTIANGANQKSLVYSTRSNRQGALSLDGATVSATNAYVSLSPAKAIDNASVQFFLDDRLIWTEQYAPYDLGGTRRDGTPNGMVLPRGTHTLRLVIALPEGVTVASDSATFTRT